MTECYNEWKYYSHLYYISEILQKTRLVRSLICKNDFGLPRELWEMILCDYIERDICLFLPIFIKNCDQIVLKLHNTLCFNIKKYFVKNYECIVDPINIMKFINIGDIVIADCYKECFFSVVVDVNVEYKIITLIESFNTNFFLNVFDISDNFVKIDCIKNVVLEFEIFSFTRILNFHEFLFMIANKFNYKTYVLSSKFNYNTHVLSSNL